MRVARSYDDDDELPFRRFATAIMKYWICKRGPIAAVEALECLGGNGFVEESIMPQFFRDIEIGTVWEGSGNVAALDVLRAMVREPEGLPAFIDECELARGRRTRCSTRISRVCGEQLGSLDGETSSGARAGSSRTSRVALQASLLVRDCAPGGRRRLLRCPPGDDRRVFGTLPRGTDPAAIAERALTT